MRATACLRAFLAIHCVHPCRRPTVLACPGVCTCARASVRGACVRAVERACTRARATASARVRARRGVCGAHAEGLPLLDGELRVGGVLAQRLAEAVDLLRVVADREAPVALRRPVAEARVRLDRHLLAEDVHHDAKRVVRRLVQAVGKWQARLSPWTKV
eukprot:1865343-Pleurochrysis_carterae.AAC.2